MMEYMIVYGVIAVLAFWPMSIAFPKHPALALTHAVLWPWPLMLYSLVWVLLPALLAALKALWSPLTRVHAFIVSVEAARPNTVFEDYEGRIPK
jgi:hypothetical protein